MFNDKLSALKHLIRCPYCSNRLPIEVAHSVHILKIPTQCTNSMCGNHITYESITISAFIKNYNNDRFGRISDFSTVLTFDHSISTWKAFNNHMQTLIKSNASSFKDNKVRARAFFMRRQFETVYKTYRDNISPIFSMDLVQGVFKLLSSSINI